jgi:DNA-directed RNA polymerase subunit RPC12/RpoP
LGFLSLAPGGIVTKIFWVTCPQCKGEFYCHYQELRRKKIKLLCPYCSHQFLDEESSKIVE